MDYFDFYTLSVASAISSAEDSKLREIKMIINIIVIEMLVLKLILLSK